MTATKRLEVLNKTLDSVTRYNGPVCELGNGEAGTDDDLFALLMQFKDKLEARIEEVKEAV